MDKYALPVYVADTARELSKICGYPSNHIENNARAKPNKRKPKRFVLVWFDDEDDE